MSALISCKQFEVLLIESLEEPPATERHESMRAHSESCSTCRVRAEGVLSTWQHLDELPLKKPGEGLRSKFQVMLNSETERMKAEENVRHASSNPGQRMRFRQIASIAAALILGLVTGYVVGDRGSGFDHMDQLQSELIRDRRLLTTSLLESSSISRRLQGIQRSYQSTLSDSEIRALITITEQDSNPAMRLAALNGLAQDLPKPELLIRLCGSLPAQESPVVQLSVIDLLGGYSAECVPSALHALLERNDLNGEVKMRAQRLLDYEM